MTRPLMLMILDGWGINPSAENNAVAQARTPNLDTLLATYPTTEIQTSGMAVGLPDGQMGNSEVGHLNIGAGRVVYQDLTRITKAIQDGDFFTNPVLLECIAKTKAAGGRLHLAGLLSDGGVHSHNTHLYALLELAKRQGIRDVFVHAILDGRDTPPKSGADYLAQLEAEIARIGVGSIATVMGRYWAMDRDNRWERVERAYNAMVQGEGAPRGSSAEAIEASYAADVTDEFAEPSVMVRDGAPVGQLRDRDGFIFFNFRSDRAREITRALALPDCEGFARQARPKLASYVCMTEYDATFGLPIAFGPEELKNILGDVLAHAGIRQLRIAETEKYAHVTFFFNGGVEEPFPHEERCLIPSPKEVATYDQKPEMSAYPVTDELLKRIDSDAYDVVIVNFANADMVGHTGILEAAARAVEAVDNCVGRIVAKVREKGGAVIITADHGNAERMVDETGGPHTAHTSEPVHLVLADDSRKGIRLRAGTLADIAPTMLEILGLSQPAEMTGKSLIVQ
ncbi:2,3-bisphosphoglycerate-independent phosphoglycerate mutase [Geobacter hydrogenophilus]|uniref:2,3-bisphosphoglycerate-independent phosphoglycerate mutase n=1 Tax=Geobacter hydrogenophilus TaxID=40983 RepID=A0A9W6LCA0_9BACT|nr:2,3-bisphosphoglycerate-independent phosphoglycerate mutase [Geobacter hydrogenophilus]MBT0893608.1 2,3-bisphosphoglycerate-independent phosphoglycerate mutase [Geobacter hydrogenophilus]GLI37695.1 2,3-bisphosphoglycerate-independent phosphoglycerate mutase [Geobacter hydrogenophilus]